MRSLLARPVFLFGNLAVVVLCVVLFLAPFALRGARMSLSRMENNVKDWLPSDFPETKDLEWFGNHFIGERFVLITWPGCTEADPQFELIVKKLRNEVLVEDRAQALQQMASSRGEAGRKQAEERLRAREIGDRLGLLALADPASYHENWGGRGEKWLRGLADSWYFITPQGELYRWDGKANLPSSLWRAAQRLLFGQNRATGELIANLGEPTDNEFHRDPRRLGARFFKTMQTGPEVLEQLTAEGGPLWPRLDNTPEEEKPLVARKRALERLTGSLYGPAVVPGFDWQPSSLWDVLPEATRNQLPADWEARFTAFVERLIDKQYAGDRAALIAASSRQQSAHWDALFLEFNLEPPPRQTSIVLTLSEPGKRDLGRVIGRPLLGEPPGKLLDLAMNECELPLSAVKLGGPPVDNVAIDEEGTITLFNLIGWSALMGLGLSYICFRSVRLTAMVFFVGGVSAVASLSIVWWCGASVDAVLMTMPSLVYVLGLAGAVHIVNYYREAVSRHGIEGAPERALADGWGPCTLAAFTTALGLLSLYASNLMPIKKFGLFSAIGVMTTLTLLFTYLPAALQIWPARRRVPQEDDPQDGDRQAADPHAGGLSSLVERFWLWIGHRVIERNALVAFGCILVMVVVGLGLTKINTSVQLLKLFDSDAKIIQDYRWLETHFGKLVPMELVIRVQPQMLQPPLDDLQDADETTKEAAKIQLSFLERIELTARVQKAVEAVFGEGGKGVVGRGLSAATFAPELPPANYPSIRNPTRWGFNQKLEASRDEILSSDYLRIEEDDSELWRISLRVGALNDVDYGVFLHQQKLVVEPLLSAYRHREELLKRLQQLPGLEQVAGARVGLLGMADPATTAGEAHSTTSGEETGRGINQTQLFGETLKDLLTVAGCQLGWFDPSARDQEYFTSQAFGDVLASAECFVLVNDHPHLDLDFVRDHARLLIDARDHRFVLGETGAQTAVQRHDPIQVVYTGVIPVVYKAQRTLLNSLVKSIGLAFAMIAVVMMVLLRDWRSRPSLTNLVNLPAGMVSMVPNVFPVVVIFGAMGHMNLLVDIGTMMCASVAMGVAVDDTIHFLTWFRQGLRNGLDRNEAILGAYRRVATAMTQTTLIGGLGLSVFAFSTFTPTQRFGVMMVTLLAAALVGDLILLPALLASPLGRWFCPRSRYRPAGPSAPTDEIQLVEEAATTFTSRQRAKTPHSGRPTYRTDAPHHLPRH